MCPWSSRWIRQNFLFIRVDPKERELAINISDYDKNDYYDYDC